MALIEMPSGPETEFLFLLTLPARPERLALVRTIVQRAVESVGCSDELGRRLVVAVNEACMNIIEHACKADTDGRFTLEASRTGPSLCFRLEDNASPIDPDTVKPRELADLRPGGLGVHFIREIMDTFRIGHLPGGRGNFLEMTKDIE